jgi:glycosyltransferase involved in cell wall biosynthesis
MRTRVEVIVHTTERTLARLRATETRPDVTEAIGCNPDCGFVYTPSIDIVNGSPLEVYFTVATHGGNLAPSPIIIGGLIPSNSSGRSTNSRSTELIEVGNEWPTIVAIFDEVYYEKEAHIELDGYIDKLKHFAKFGIWHGLSPSLFFDASTYCDRAKEAGLPALVNGEPAFVHWLRHGLPAHIVPTHLFDEDSYQNNYSNMISENDFGFYHFISKGCQNGLKPNLWFDPEWYANKYSLELNNLSAFSHFVNKGIELGNSPNSIPISIRRFETTLLDWSIYGGAITINYSQLSVSIGEERASLLLAMFQPSYYRVIANLPSEITSLGTLNHFLSIGLASDFSPSPLFEPNYYRTEWLRVTGTEAPLDQPLILHWLGKGRETVAVPTRLFLEQHYRTLNADMIDPSIDVFAHYIRHGIRENRTPNPWFDQIWYTDSVSEYQRHDGLDYISFLVNSQSIACASRELWLLSGGPSNTINSSGKLNRLDFIDAFSELVRVTAPLLAQLTIDKIKLAALFFAPELYRGFDDVPEEFALIKKLTHFFSFEIFHGEKVGPLFSGGFYRQQVAAHTGAHQEIDEPFLHFLQFGVDQRILPSSLFDEKTYLLANSDLVSYPGWLFLHFIKHGIYEFRIFNEQTMISLANDFSMSPTNMARQRILIWASQEHVDSRELSRSEYHFASRAQAKAMELVRSSSFADIMKHAQSIEPLVGERLQRRDILAPPIHDEIWSKFRLLKSRLKRNHYDNVICIPWLRTGGADLVSGFLSHALRQLFPEQSILLLRTDQPQFERMDWLPDGIDILDMSDISKACRSEDAERLLFTLIRGLRPSAVYNVNSRLCWQFLRRFGSRFENETRFYAYLFCWDQTKSGTRVGYPSEFFADTQGCLTALLTDTLYLKNELIRTYCLPNEISNKIVPLASPSNSNLINTTMAEQGVQTSCCRTRPLILWGGRLDLQKRFDLVIKIAERLSSCDFWCWGFALLDEAPDHSSLPPNITMKGAFKALRDLPLGDADGWLFTSAWEGMPTTIIELGILGMPIVASAVGGIPELIDESTGWLVAPYDDIEGFISCLTDMIDQPEERIKRGANLQMRVQARHNMEAYKTALAQVILAGSK